jgi:biotin carboxyl carrier protein
MKMQNLIKSETEGKVKSVKVKAGAAVGVDEVLIEFE